VEASKVLEPERDWEGEGIYAEGVSEGTWKAFLYNQRKDGINTNVFKAYCAVLNLLWQEVVEPTIDQQEEVRTLESIPSNIPRSGLSPEQFFGRNRALEDLHQYLQQGRQVAITAVAGMGGVGKTELAIQYAQLHLETFTGGMCWLSSRRGDIRVQIVEFAIVNFSNFTLPDGLTLDGQVKFCWKRWPQGQVLVVVDDVDDYRQVKPYLPPESASRFKVLITTRERLGKPLIRIDLDVLKPKPALSLLKSLVGRERLNREAWVARKLCKWLGYLPLGLELVGRYLAEDEELSLAEMLQRLKVKCLQHPALEKSKPEMTAQLGVAAAFELTWERLDANTRSLGCMLALFAPAPIPWSLVEEFTAAEKDFDFQETRANLIRFNLLKSLGRGNYLIHQLIKAFLVDKLIQSNNLEFRQSFVHGLIAISKKTHESPLRKTTLKYSSIIPHLEELAENLLTFVDDADFTQPFVFISWFYQGLGLYSVANSWAKKCLVLARDRYDLEHPNIAFSLNSLGDLYRIRGQYDEAKTFLLQALELFRKLSRDDHYYLQGLRGCLNNLGLLYDSQNFYDGAEPLYKQAIEVGKNISHEADKYTAVTLNNLALLYSHQGLYHKAEPLYKQALEIRTKSLTDKHPDVADRLNNLAGVYRFQGRYAKAEKLYQQAIQIYKDFWDEETPDVAMSMNNLSLVYLQQNRSSEAKKLAEQALEIRKRLLGYQHPLTVQSMGNVAAIYTIQNCYGKAEVMLLESLKLQRRLLGDEHTEVAAIQSNLSHLYAVQGFYEGQSIPIQLFTNKLSKKSTKV
jgi:tetratricopeptide (TPR) repeat protein